MDEYDHLAKQPREKLELLRQNGVNERAIKSASLLVETIVESCRNIEMQNMPPLILNHMGVDDIDEKADSVNDNEELLIEWNCRIGRINAFISCSDNASDILIIRQNDGKEHLGTTTMPRMESLPVDFDHLKEQADMLVATMMGLVCCDS